VHICWPWYSIHNGPLRLGVRSVGTQRRYGWARPHTMISGTVRNVRRRCSSHGTLCRTPGPVKIGDGQIIAQRNNSSPSRACPHRPATANGVGFANGVLTNRGLMTNALGQPCRARTRPVRCSFGAAVPPLKEVKRRLGLNRLRRPSRSLQGPDADAERRLQDGMYSVVLWTGYYSVVPASNRLFRRCGGCRFTGLLRVFDERLARCGMPDHQVSESSDSGTARPHETLVNSTLCASSRRPALRYAWSDRAGVG
jgi:hypothetical protein